MTPNFITRSLSNDQYIFDSVFFNNKYKIKGQKDSQRIFLDLGAHIGTFTFAALMLGARKVYTLEPFIDSFNILLQNVYNPHFRGQVTPYQIGVDIYSNQLNQTINFFSTPQLINNLYFDFANIKILGDKKENHYPCVCLTLDQILENYCYGENIDVLKINIGYAEREILITSNLLKLQVNAICGEAELNEEDIIKFKKDLGIKGYIHFHSIPTNSDGRTQFWASKLNLSENFNI